MRKTKFTETQIVKALQEHEGGRDAKEICRELGITTAAFYKWRQRYGGLEASDLKKMKDLESDLSKYKRIVAEQALQITVLKDVIEKKL